jgi:hypothetical protein
LYNVSRSDAEEFFGMVDKLGLQVGTSLFAFEQLQDALILAKLGRPFLADPDWVRKTDAGDEVAILRCAAYHQGCLAKLRKGYGTSCLFNPLTGREAEVQITPVEQPRQVMVAGGGPAGWDGEPSVSSNSTVSRQRLGLLARCVTRWNNT